MQFLALLAAVTALCASGASATCYGSGADWGNKDDANKKLVDACNTLTGTYAPNQQRSACREAVGGGLFSAGKYDFVVHNQNNYAFSLSPDVCVRNLRREITFCNAGGYETFGNVFFRYVGLSRFVCLGGRDCSTLADLRRADPDFGNC